MEGGTCLFRHVKALSNYMYWVIYLFVNVIQFLYPIPSYMYVWDP